MKDKKLTLLQHFSELRRRVLWTVLIFSGLFCTGWFVAPIAQEFLTSPLMSVWTGATMLYTGLSDGLMIQFGLATLFALVLTLPVLLWHAWAFVSPALNQDERKIIFPMLILSPILFVVGAAFAFYILFPVVFRFFVELNLSATVPSVLIPSVTNYLTFAIGMLKVFGIAFQMPLVLVLLNRVGVLPRTAMIKSRRYAMVGIFLVAAVLTPPDIFSQCLLAVPLWLLFEISIFFMKK